MTTKAKHTPGPWEKNASFIEGADRKAVAQVLRHGDEYDANSALIESAPDLLAACKDSAKRIRELCKMVNSFSVQLGLGKKVNADDWDEEVRAAIDKAEGNQ